MVVVPHSQDRSLMGITRKQKNIEERNISEEFDSKKQSAELQLWAGRSVLTKHRCSDVS